MQTKTGVTVIDQHAAHERVLYERAIKAMNKEYSYSQNLLFKVKIKMNSSDVSIIKEIEEDLKNLGYEFKLIEPDSVEISGVPLDVRAGDEEYAFHQIIELFDEYQKVRHTNKRDNLAASFSCKAAIKTGEYLSKDEMRKLINDLMSCDMPFSCPHGRPTILEFPLTEYDKRFGRT